MVGILIVSHGAFGESLIHSASHVLGKRQVGVAAIEPVGVYAVKLVFTDGHDTGIYSWDYLHELGMKQEANWKTYLARLEQAGKSRDAQ